MPSKPDFGAGVELTAELLQALADYCDQNKVRVAPGGGLKAAQFAEGLLLAVERRPSMGFFGRLTAESGGGAYTFVRTPEAASGGWDSDDTSLTGTCYERSAST